MTDIDARIERLQNEIAELEKVKSVGYDVEQVTIGCVREDYDVRNDHDVIWDVEGNLAGIVINLKVMKKYFADIGEIA